METVEELSARIRTLELVVHATGVTPPDRGEEIKALKKRVDALAEQTQQAEQKATQASAAASRDLVTGARLQKDLHTITIGVGEAVAEITNKLESDFERKLKDSALSASQSARSAEQTASALARSMADMLIGKTYTLAHGSGAGSVRAAKDASLSALKAAASSVDASFIAIKGPSRPPRSATAGQLLEWSVTNRDSAQDVPSIMRSLKGVRSSLKSRIADADKPLADAGLQAGLYADIAKYLKGEGALPDSDPVLAAAASIVRKAAELGSMPNPADEIEGHALAAFSAIADARGKADHVKTAAGIGISRQHVKALERFALAADGHTKDLLTDMARRMQKIIARRGEAAAIKARARKALAGE